MRGGRLDFALEIGEVAVADLGGPGEVAVAFGALGVGAHRVEAFLELLDDADGVLLALPVGAHRVGLFAQVGELLVEGEQRSSDAGSVSLPSATRSISRPRMRRSTTSISVGTESISMRSELAASSMRSMALSGRNRPVR